MRIHRKNIVAVVSTVAAAAVVFQAACLGQPGAAADYEIAPASSASEAPEIEPYTPRFGRERPVVAVVGQNRHSELTDFVVPHGVLAASGAAEVVAVSTEAGPIEMFPALTFEADATIQAFDRSYPEGADYVVVPAVHDSGDPALTEWLRAQHRRGATIVGVCDGVLVLAEAGLLDGRRATSHWYSMDGLAKSHPGTTWVKNRRYVADDRVITTTGVSASVPVSLALVEAIADRETAARVAARYGVEDWSAEHDSGRYGVSARGVLTAAANHLAFWRHEDLGIDVEDDVDEVSLALSADLWSRTMRSSVRSVGDTGQPVETRSGLRVVPDRVRGGADAPSRAVPEALGARSEPVIDIVLRQIAETHGEHTAELVALQIEHPWSAEAGR